MPSTTQRGYGRQHQRARQIVAKSVDAGEAYCTRCGRPIIPGSRWHLDHTEDRSGYRGAAHASCNVKAGARLGAQRRWAKWRRTHRVVGTSREW